MPCAAQAAARTAGPVVFARTHDPARPRRRRPARSRRRSRSPTDATRRARAPPMSRPRYPCRRAATGDRRDHVHRRAGRRLARACRGAGDQDRRRTSGSRPPSRRRAGRICGLRRAPTSRARRGRMSEVALLARAAHSSRKRRRARTTAANVETPRLVESAVTDDQSVPVPAPRSDHAVTARTSPPSLRTAWRRPTRRSANAAAPRGRLAKMRFGDRGRDAIALPDFREPGPPPARGIAARAARQASTSAYDRGRCRRATPRDTPRCGGRGTDRWSRSS